MGELCENKKAKLVGISFRIRTGHTRNRCWIAGGEERRLVRKYDGCLLIINNLCYQIHFKEKWTSGSIKYVYVFGKVLNRGRIFISSAESTQPLELIQTDNECCRGLFPGSYTGLNVKLITLHLVPTLSTSGAIPLFLNWQICLYVYWWSLRVFWCTTEVHFLQILCS